MESPAGRLLRVLSLLQTRPTWTAEELAERLGVTTRTVRRDVTRLRDLGYPVEAAPGPFGGYQLGAGGSLPPLLLSDDEAVAIAVGLRVNASSGIAGIEESSVAALAKLEQVLPTAVRERLTALDAATVSPERAGGGRVDPNLLVKVAQACRRSERIHFDYTTGAGVQSERRVEPYRLVSMERRWYLVARDRDRDDWRTFRVDRMAGVVPAGHRFTLVDPPDAIELVREGLTLSAYPFKATVVLLAPLEWAQRAVSPNVGTIEPHPDGALLRFGADDAEWMAHYLAWLPFPCRVEDPPELRRALHALGRRLSREHQG